MNESKENIRSNFESKEKAFEYLIQQSQNQLLKDRWKMELNKLPDVHLDKSGVVRNIFYKNVVAIVAGIIVVLGSFYWYTNRAISLEQLVEVMIVETRFVLESDAQIRGVDEKVTDELRKEEHNEINSALEHEDYLSAVDLYLIKEKKNQLSLDDKFYFSLSLARIKNGDHYKAIRMLEEVIVQKNKYYSEALWLQALLYLKVNDHNKSKIILNVLKNNSAYQNSNINILLETMVREDK